MCLVRMPRMPDVKTPAPPPSSPEKSAAEVQGAPENPFDTRPANRRNKLRIDLKADVFGNGRVLKRTN